MTETHLVALRAATRDELTVVVREMVFTLNPVQVGAVMNNLASNALDQKIHREFMTSILMLASSMVDANMRSCKSMVVHPSQLAHCLENNLSSYYKEAGLTGQHLEHRRTVGLN